MSVETADSDVQVLKKTNSRECLLFRVFFVLPLFVAQGVSYYQKSETQF